MKSRMLNINDSFVSGRPMYYTCYGLGSCVGIFIIDRLACLSGGGHVALPSDSRRNNDLLGAEEVVTNLLRQFQSMGSAMWCLQVKLAGGAKVIENSYNTGEQTVESVRAALSSRGIPIKSQDVGGRISR